MTKFSVTTLATEGVIAPVDLMPKLATWGYDGIEIWGGDRPGSQHVTWFRDDSVRIAQVYPGDRATDAELDALAHLKAVADRVGLAIPMISPYFDFISGPERFDESLRVGARYVEYARALECRLIRTMTGGSGSARGSVPSRLLTDAEWDACIRGLKALSALPGAENVVYAIETHSGRPEDTIETVLRQMREVEAPNVRVLLQPNQFIARVPGVTAQGMLEALYPYTVHLHEHTGMKDNPVGWQYILAELRRRNFDGYLSIERARPEPRLQALEQEIVWLRSTV
ncbi:MAG: sugar phosphate isomerase/epimerase [Dehalococcoidia bacterium]|nr:sugar phosphate isomerase/epimerase [Dehalococcoidia bacterium]